MKLLETNSKPNRKKKQGTGVRNAHNRYVDKNASVSRLSRFSLIVSGRLPLSFFIFPFSDSTRSMFNRKGRNEGDDDFVWTLSEACEIDGYDYTIR